MRSSYDIGWRLGWNMTEAEHAIIRAAEEYRDGPTSRLFAVLMAAVDKYREERAEKLRLEGVS